MSELYLVHHGIKGQRWGVRRFQNEDGSLTEAGKKKYGNVNDSSELQGKFKEKYERDNARLKNIQDREQYYTYDKNGNERSNFQKRVAASTYGKSKGRLITEMVLADVITASLEAIARSRVNDLEDNKSKSAYIAAGAATAASYMWMGTGSLIKVKNITALVQRGRGRM